MADEIEEFLRRAAQRRAAQAAQQQAAQQQPQQFQPPPPPPPRPVAPAPRPALAPTYVEPQPVEVEVVYDEPELGAGVSSHVAQAMDNRQFTERASHLGEVVGLADDNMDAHLHQKFDHQVGQLRSTTAAVPAVAPSPSFEQARHGDAGAAPAGAGDAAAHAAGVSAAEIAQLLRTPRNIRYAVIMNEVLTRPEGRW
jgi:hypothetical protein